ncbi:MAG: hypothetical protein EBV66_01465 [Actinobacteria bacterium]|nr:hypothetical protein [Actinomycetota bacterium]
MTSPPLLPDDTVSRAYIELRNRVMEILRSLSESDGNLVVPHCPSWSVRELASHLLGVPDDIVNGRMDGVASDEWTKAQVERHRGKSLLALAHELAELAPRFDPILPHIPPMARSQMTMDAVTHEHDLRNAVAQPGARDSLAVQAALAWLGVWAEKRVPGSHAALFGAGLDDFDLLRCLTGRRSIRQAKALGLKVDVLEAVQKDSPLRAPANDLME